MWCWICNWYQRSIEKPQKRGSCGNFRRSHSVNRRLGGVRYTIYWSGLLCKYGMTRFSRQIFNQLFSVECVLNIYLLISQNKLQQIWNGHCEICLDKTASNANADMSISDTHWQSWYYNVSKNICSAICWTTFTLFDQDQRVCCAQLICFQNKLCYWGL